MYMPNNINQNCGIYRILNKRNGKYYIGSSKNIKRRFKTHLNELNKGKHKNTKLQLAWNAENDKSMFVFHGFIYCKSEDLIKIEQNCLDIMRPKYNISRKAANNSMTTEQAKKAQEKVPKEKRIERARIACLSVGENRVGENLRNWQNNLSKQERSEISKKAVDVSIKKYSQEDRKLRGKKASESLTKEQRSQRIKDGWITLKNKLSQQEISEMKRKAVMIRWNKSNQADIARENAFLTPPAGEE
jgi:group I intron endonuclease